MIEIDRKEVFNFQTINLFNKDPHLFYAFSSALFGDTAYKIGKIKETREARVRFAKAAGFDLEKTVFMSPVHKVNMCFVDQSNCGAGVWEKETAIPRTDALITTGKGIPLAINVADCTPVIITNKNHEFVTLVHVGREGINLGINQLVVSKLAELGFDNPADFHVGLGPTNRCYEQPFIDTDYPERWLPYLSLAEDVEGEVAVQTCPSENFRYRLGSTMTGIKLRVDVITACIYQLTEIGIPKENIEASEICTSCEARKGRLYSYAVYGLNKNTPEADKYPDKRFMAVVQLNP